MEETDETFFKITKFSKKLLAQTMHDLAGLDGPLAGLDDFDEILALESEWEQVRT
jgi:hypothetical protein